MVQGQVFQLPAYFFRIVLVVTEHQTGKAEVSYSGGASQQCQRQSKRNLNQNVISSLLKSHMQRVYIQYRGKIPMLIFPLRPRRQPSRCQLSS